MWGSAVCLRHGMHLRADFVVLALPRKARLVTFIINTLIIYLTLKITQAGFVPAEMAETS